VFGAFSATKHNNDEERSCSAGGARSATKATDRLRDRRRHDRARRRVDAQPCEQPSAARRAEQAAGRAVAAVARAAAPCAAAPRAAPAAGGRRRRRRAVAARQAAKLFVRARFAVAPFEGVVDLSRVFSFFFGSCAASNMKSK